jgi:hypothetical protein
MLTDAEAVFLYRAASMSLIKMGAGYGVALMLLVAVYFIALLLLIPSGARSLDRCFEQYGLCRGYCEPESGTRCILRCEDQKMQCERPKRKPRSTRTSVIT